MSLISELPHRLCEWFSDLNEFSDCSVSTKFPIKSKTTPLDKPVLVFGAKSVKVFDNVTDESGAVITESYIADVDFSIGIHVPRSMGGSVCFSILDSVTDRLLFSTNLAISSIVSDSLEYIRNTDSLFLELVFTVNETLKSDGKSGKDFTV